MFDLSGKVALVTGASRGLGWAMARSLAQAGAHVVLNARDGAALQARVDELGALGLKAEAAACDVTDEAAMAALVAGVAQRHGRLDIGVANAGIQHRKPITEFDTADFRRVLDTNLTAVWVLARECARVMIPARRGRIVVTGSISALLARPTISAYIASKGAVHALTRELAMEMAPHGITVNAIAPGYFATEMNTTLMGNAEFNDWVCRRTPAGRWGRPEEIGPPVVFLASDEASFVNGHVLVVDGAFTAAM
ncbi:MAG: SDR family NAD(P)-dependent oxidoreductase [Betaproteobacteria bacterium]|jgi:gluconate 5-dehydrogenase|nr:glucose 1-dehydrogenase [Betaproteobacteria bacterium]